MFGELVWVLVVIACWASIATVAVFLIRFAARETDDEQIVCELGPDYFSGQPALT